MIFGKSYYEKIEEQAEKVMKQRAKEALEQEKLKEEYHAGRMKTFAWIPVQLNSGQYVWLQHVYYVRSICYNMKTEQFICRGNRIYSLSYDTHR